MQNLARNPTCANNVADWPGPSWQRLTGQTVAGRTTGARFTAGSNAWPNIGGAGAFPANDTTHGGRTLSYVAWVRSSTARTYIHSLAKYDAAATHRGQAVYGGTLSLAANTWTVIRGRGVVAAGGDYTALGVHSDTPDGVAGTIDVAAVRIDLVDDPGLDYADGDTPGWTWTGAVGNSASVFATSEPEPEPEPDTEPEPDPLRATPPTLTEPARVQRPEWSFVVGPASGGLLRELTARSRKVSFKLTEPSEASCEVDGRSPSATVVDELATDLFVYRAPTVGGRRRLMYRGRISNVSDTFDAAGHTVTIPSLDYRAVLARRLLMSGSQQTWTQQDQATIAFGLIQQAQRLAPSYGIAPGEGATTGVKRDRTYDLGDSIGDRIQELSEVMDGFDWDVTPTSATELALDIWYPHRGVVQPIVLEYGGAVVSGTRTVDSKEYANHVRVTGTQPEGGGAEPAIQERQAAGIASRPEGRWDKTYGESITTTKALEERADWQIDQAQVITPTYSLKLRTGWWRGPGHLWLGDTVSVRIKSGRLRVNTQLRVRQIDVDLSDDGTEDVTLTVGGPKPDYRRRATDIEKRLTLLERR